MLHQYTFILHCTVFSLSTHLYRQLRGTNISLISKGTAARTIDNNPQYKRSFTSIIDKVTVSAATLINLINFPC